MAKDADYPNPYGCGYWAAALQFSRSPPDGDGQKKAEWKSQWLKGYDGYESKARKNVRE